MRNELCGYLAVMVIAGRALAFPASDYLATMPMSSLYGRDESEDPYDEDLSYLTKWAAIGDSYSAGIGAGSMLNRDYWDFQCRRYDMSYPWIINQDPRLGDGNNRNFQFKSCSGAETKDIIEKQLPDIDYGQQVILLSAGGNDVLLTDILNHCVYQWATVNKVQYVVGKIEQLKEKLTGEEKGWANQLDWESLFRGCDGQVELTHDIIEGEHFSKQLDATIEGAKKKLASGGKIYYTGYAKFFSETLDSDCGQVTWLSWVGQTTDIAKKPEYLGYNKRRTLNRLVDMVNEEIEAAVKRAGPDVKFINYDEYVGRYHGRFCEAGVDEGTVESGERPELMFYKLNSLDPFGGNPWKRSDEEHLNGTFGGDVNIMAWAYEKLDSQARLAHDGLVHDEADDEAKAKIQALKEIEEVNSNAISDWFPNLMPDGYARVFHPQVFLHELIANLILFEISNDRIKKAHLDTIPVILEPVGSCPIDQPGGHTVLEYKSTKPGKEVADGTKLRILPVGDSITVGFLSDKHGGDGNGYRGQLKKDLSKNEVVFAGTESSGTMDGGYYAAWSGKTIKYVSDHVGPSLEQRPNVILLSAGTNDMNADPNISTEGNDPKAAADRLGKLIDKMIKACPDAIILVSMIINTCNQDQAARTKEFQKLIPDVVKKRKADGKKVLAADFTTYDTSNLVDCIHPTNPGYELMGDWWYDFVTQIPSKWIKDPVGDDPDGDGDEDNGGIDKNIPPPDWGKSPIQVTSKDRVDEVAGWARGGEKGNVTCKSNPQWKGTGKIASGNVGHNGDWKYHKNWKAAGEVAEGLGWENRFVRLHDMNGDGKADYVWVHPETGEIRCWLNNLPKPWSPAGNNHATIGSGVGPAKTIFLADMNGDGMDDYVVVNPDNGSVRVWWNYGPDDDWDNGWKFVEGGEIASGVPHANLKTLRFPDINGDGRADYVYIGKGGSLKHHMNTGSVGGRDVLFHAMGGIATGAVRDISTLGFADMNGDGRDDYLIWDDDGGLTGFLNQPTNREGVPLYVNQGPAKTIADGIHKDPSTIRLADMDGDGKDDYVHIGEHGSLTVWYNRGTVDDGTTIDGLRFADIDGDGVDDYVWVDPKSGAPTVYLNSGVDDADSLGWAWKPLNDGKPIASGAAPGSQVVFGDIDGDGLDDYLDLNAETGLLKAYLNDGKDKGTEYGWKFNPIGEIASGLGPGHRVRIADIDGDGQDDYIYLKDNGGTTIYRNVYDPNDSGNKYEALPDADASGIGQSPDEIDFVDLNGDGKADYVWTRRLDGRVKVWYNEYPDRPAWREGGELAEGVGTSGANVRYAKLQSTGRADYVAVDPETGSIAAWLNGCSDPVEPPPPSDDRDTPDTSKNEKKCYNSGQKSSYGKIEAAANSFCKNLEKDAAGPVFSDFYRSDKKQPPGSYHFAVTFEVFEGCKWEYSYNECMRYYRVPIDSCNCSQKGKKQGGTVKNNCIYARIDPNWGI